MKMRSLSGFVVACIILSLLPAAAQLRHDPLSDIEINKLRDAAQVPDARLKLYIEFARTRLAGLDEMRADSKVKDRGQQTHDRLTDFLNVYDELDDNVDTFVKRQADLRKSLKLLIDADAEFQAKLRALRDAAGVSPTELQQYEFVLSSALDTLDSDAKDHRDLLAEQEETFKHKKKSSSSSSAQEFR
jgi:hypothetical protein